MEGASNPSGDPITTPSQWLPFCRSVLFSDQPHAGLVVLTLLALLDFVSATCGRALAVYHSSHLIFSSLFELKEHVSKMSFCLEIVLHSCG